MHRRDFLKRMTLVGSAAAFPRLTSASAFPAGGSKIAWQRDSQTRLFTGVSADGTPLVARAEPGLFVASCRLAGESAAGGLLPVTVEHRLHDSGEGHGEDVLEATLTVRNTSDRPRSVALEFATCAQPSLRVDEQRVYVPLSAAGLFGDARFAALGVKQFLKDCQQAIGRNDFQCHYLEPMASDPGQRETRALLLAPVVDIRHPLAPWRVAMCTPSDQPMRFSHHGGVWRASRQVTIPAGGSFAQRCWLMIHSGDASVAWRAFHRFAHREEFPPIGWIREMKVHYYDFLSSAQGERGRRGDGYEADLPHFRTFHVGLATQHGYYPTIGDFIHPDRKTWQAMRGDKQGATEMSLDKMRSRIEATRAAGAKAAVYMHAALLDDASLCFAKLRDCVQVDSQGQRMNFGWTGPDTAGKTWRASLAAPQWREHLLQQAGWIMDILRPDAIVVDETFAGLGYDHHADRAGATSPGAIEFYRRLRALVRSFGGDKAFFTSDCSMSPFVIWADGECGDHAYPGLLGHPLYSQEPVRYLAALGDKPWRPCAWDFQNMWQPQVKLARQVGAGVGVSNGWIQYTGLTRLPQAVRRRMIADIESLA
jgi:hypothetical protein